MEHTGSQVSMRQWLQWWASAADDEELKRKIVQKFQLSTEDVSQARGVMFG
jgi:hypothetical protein